MDYIIVDTSSIIFSLSNNVDIFAAIKMQMPEYTILVSSGILKELKKIGNGKSKFGKFGRVAATLLNKHGNVKLVKDNTYVDKWISDAARERRCAVCTNDTELKKHLKSEGIRAFSISRSGLLR